MLLAPYLPTLWNHKIASDKKHQVDSWYMLCLCGYFPGSFIPNVTQPGFPWHGSNPLPLPTLGTATWYLLFVNALLHAFATSQAKQLEEDLLQPEKF